MYIQYSTKKYLSLLVSYFTRPHLNWLRLFQEVTPEWQNAASSVLVALGLRHCNDVMSELLDKFQPGTLPHYFVVQTLASLATANGRQPLHSLSVACKLTRFIKCSISCILCLSGCLFEFLPGCLTAIAAY